MAGGEGAFVEEVDGGRGDASLRLAGDSGRAAQLIIPAPERGGRYRSLSGSLGIPHYAAGPGVCFALAVTRGTRQHVLAHGKTGWPSSPSSFNYLAGLLTRKVQKWTIKLTIKGHSRFAVYKAVCTRDLGGQGRVGAGDSRAGKAGAWRSALWSCCTHPLTHVHKLPH